MQTTKKEILRNLIENIKSANNKLKNNFHQDEVKDEIDKIKEKYKNNNNKYDYSIKEGQIEYKSNYKNIFPESVKYGILSNIRDSTDERIDVVENIIGKINDSLQNIQKNLKNKKLNDKIEFNNNNKKDNSINLSSLDTDIITFTDKKQKNKINFNIVGNQKNLINILNQNKDDLNSFRNEKDFDFDEDEEEKM